MTKKTLEKCLVCKSAFFKVELAWDGSCLVAFCEKCNEEYTACWFCKMPWSWRGEQLRCLNKNCK